MKKVWLAAIIIGFVVFGAGCIGSGSNSTTTSVPHTPAPTTASYSTIPTTTVTTTTSESEYSSDSFTHLKLSNWPREVGPYDYLTVKYTVYKNGRFDYAYEYTMLPDTRIKETFITYWYQANSYTTQTATYYESSWRELMDFYPVNAFPDPPNPSIGKMRIVRIGAAPFFMTTWNYTIVNDQTIILKATTGPETVVMTYISPFKP